MRAGMVASQHIGVVQHPACDVGMQIERADDRHVFPYGLSNLFEDCACDIRLVLGRHRAVQREKDGIDFADFRQPRSKGFTHA